MCLLHSIVVSLFTQVSLFWRIPIRTAAFSELIVAQLANWLSLVIQIPGGTLSLTIHLWVIMFYQNGLDGSCGALFLATLWQISYMNE